jgi:hypothetical protein
MAYLTILAREPVVLFSLVLFRHFRETVTFLNYLFLGCPIGLFSLNFNYNALLHIHAHLFPFVWPYDWLRAGGPRDGNSSLGRVRNFLPVIQTGSGVYPASYEMGTGGSFIGGKAAGA